MIILRYIMFKLLHLKLSYIKKLYTGNKVATISCLFATLYMFIYNTIHVYL